MEASERKEAAEADASSWRVLRTMVGQLVAAKVVVAELVKALGKSEEAQEVFVSRVLHDEHLQAHPPSSKYLKTLLQIYAREIDSANEAFADSFAEELAIYNQCAAGDEPHSNTCFFVAEDCVVRCRAAIEHNDVGLRMWEAGLFLTELVHKHRQQFTHKRILELGAGLGLTSLCAAVAVPSQVLISDYSLPTLANIRYNIELNNLHSDSRAEGVQLDWCTVDAQAARELDPDIVLAADTVYDREFIPAFCDALRHFAATSKQIPSAVHHIDAIDWTVRPVILVAATRRNSDTYDTFMRALHDHGLVAVNLSESVKTDVPQQLYYHHRELIQLLQIYTVEPP